MQCFVPGCKNSPKSVPKSNGITFHKFPSDGRTYAAWLQVLCKPGTCLPRDAVVCSDHFLTEDFSVTRSGLKTLLRGAVPNVINQSGLCNIHHNSKDLDKQAEIDDINCVAVNVEMKNEKQDESLLKVDIGTLIKQEPLDQGLMITCDNVYDSHFDVFKEELCSDSLEMDNMYNCEYDVNSDFIDTLHLKEEITKVKEQDLPENENTNNYIMMTYVKVEHLDSFTSLPADCAQSLSAPLLLNYTNKEDTSLNEASSLKDNSVAGQKNYNNNNKTETGINSESSCSVSPNVNLELFQCKLCSYKCVSNAYLQRHIKKHGSERSLTCEICEFKFTRRGNLKRHMKTHSGEKTFSCDICGYKFFWKFRLDLHMRRHTAGKKCFACYMCNNKFTTKSNLMVHVKKHSGEKPFTCDICKKQYLTKGSLGVHMRNHTGEKPFSCHICENKFTTKNMLGHHMSCHSADRSFSCDICDKKYNSKCGLAIHMRNHSGRKPFSCNVCNFKTAYKSYLASHIKIHND